MELPQRRQSAVYVGNYRKEGSQQSMLGITVKKTVSSQQSMLESVFQIP